ncbi:LuxR C-terminal-related transcriptional regulator [Actinomadura sp. DC4]|uniref:helix-turn-helix transcriptional regulator n=1 Tax=Actinomadura sp. DC4 TaxID=3055069 RepID=UPI0025AF6ACA|nr:LuxR C-terminal-related transcriptional regulator [Actinomadura sp. DC4]MDN3356619.1 LuxR C-terminal-related transcriptional regulator [Actinomadura sp. DC4]
MAVATNISGRWQAPGLPADLTSFVGRRREIADVRHLLSRSRLVTLTGVGGVGKTRLAYRVTAEIRRTFPDGVWLIELAELEDPSLLADTIAGALGVQEHSSRPSMDALVDHLRERTALIVLDNCEHLLRECAALVGTLLRGAPGVRVLTTSREVLGIAGEQTLAVPPLSLPSCGVGRPSDASFARYDAVRLFAERAEAVLPDFAITGDNRAAVEAICRRLDGIPLAIELAAVRLRVLSVQQLLDRLDDRFRLLDNGSQAVLPRHRTLRALIDWSHSLCTRQERLLWARASVFSGGLDLDAAEAVCAGEGIAREDVLDLVAAMVNKSILVREEHPHGIRYRLLETMRQYGRERLAESGEEAETQRRHRDFYRGLCDEVRTGLFGPVEVDLLTRLKLENANLRTALDYCFATPAEAACGVRMAADLLYHWLTGHLREGRRRLDQGLAADREPSPGRARGLVVGSWLAVAQGEIDAAVAMLDESHRIGEELDDDRVRADVVLHRGLIALDGDEVDAAVELCGEAVARHRRTGDPAGLALALMWLNAGLTLRGDLSGALAAGEEGIALCEAHGEGLHRAYLMTMVGVTFWRQGDTGRASALARESLDFSRSLGNPRGIGINLALLAWIAAADGDHERAARLLGVLRTFAQAPGARRAIGAPVSGYRHLLRFQGACEAGVHRVLGASGAEVAIKWGAALSADEAVAYALRDELPDEVGHGRRASLTRRETEVARLIAQGLSNKQIAAKLVISQRTVEGHVEHVLGKLGFGSRTQIAVWTREQDGGSAV